MNTLRYLFLLLCLLFGPFIIRSNALAHPGSGIVVDRQGNVYFVDTGSGVWKLGTDGKLTKLTGPAYHWMAIDIEGRLAKTPPPRFSRDGAVVAKVSEHPSLYLSSDFPIAVSRDGSLLSVWTHNGDDARVFHYSPSGTMTTLKILPLPLEQGKQIPWRNGIASTPDGSVYYTEHNAIRRIRPDGEVVTVVRDVNVDGCDPIPDLEPGHAPYLRGLDVDSAGNVFVAASGCRAVLKVTTDGRVTKILSAESPWSPTGVAVFGQAVFVLEYLHTPGDDRREWIPRVRRIDADGRIVTVATIKR